MNNQKLEAKEKLELDVHLKEYESLRAEIIFRLKDKNTLLKYVVILIGAVIGGLWKGSYSEVNSIYIMIIFLIIVPVISTILAFCYTWHDDVIIKLASYIHNEVRPKICNLCENGDLLEWEIFLNRFRQRLKILSYPNLGRLILIVPIVISIGGYLLIENLQGIVFIKWFFIFVDFFLVILICYGFIKINKIYKDEILKNIKSTL